jgi:hypothetical protein
MNKKARIELIKKIKKLTEKYKTAEDLTTREYIKQKIINFITELENKGINKDDISPILYRIKNSTNYGRFYSYGLAENLNEQIVIVADSIRASPLHQKKIELKNTAMIQFADKLEK